MAYKSLWNHITITWNTFNTERIEHYYKLAKGMEISLIIGKAMGGTNELGESEIRLKDIFKEEKVIKRITCLLYYPNNAGVTSFLYILPPAREMYYLRASHTDRYLQAMLPLRNCESIKKLLIDCAMVGYAQDVELEEFTMTLPPKTSELYSGSTISAYIQRSIDTIQVISIHNQSYGMDPRRVCPNIHTLRMSLEELAKVFLPSYEVPNLKKLEITSSAIPSNTDWERVKPAISNKVTIIVCHSMEGLNMEMVTFLRNFTCLQTLELRGKSVDPLLEAFDEFDFKKLNLLTICSYGGTGQPVVDYLRRRVITKGFPVSAKEKLQVEIESCIRIPPESMAIIRSLADVGE